MKNLHTATTVSCAKPWGQIHVPLAFLTLLLIGSVPQTALGQGFVINQPDAYVVVEPIASERSIIIEEPEPSWVIVQTAPPPVRFEVRSRVPYAGAIWVGGYWWWSGVRYVWIGGHYVRPMRGYRFVAPRWVFSGGYHYHIRGHYRPYGATVQHRTYHHYRQGGYYGHRYDHSGRHRPTTYPGQNRGHNGHSRGHNGHNRGHNGHNRGYDGHNRGYNGHNRGHGDEHRGHNGRNRGHDDKHRGYDD